MGGIFLYNGNTTIQLPDSNGYFYGLQISENNVWLVFHGWNGDFGQFTELGQTIARAKPNDIVLALDWTQIAHTLNKDNDNLAALRLGENFIATSWIRPLAEQIKETLKNWGF